MQRSGRLVSLPLLGMLRRKTCLKIRHPTNHYKAQQHMLFSSSSSSSAETVVVDDDALFLLDKQFKVHMRQFLMKVHPDKMRTDSSDKRYLVNEKGIQSLNMLTNLQQSIKKKEHNLVNMYSSLNKIKLGFYVEAKYSEVEIDIPIDVLYNVENTHSVRRFNRHAFERLQYLFNLAGITVNGRSELVQQEEENKRYRDERPADYIPLSKKDKEKPEIMEEEVNNMMMEHLYWQVETTTIEEYSGDDEVLAIRRRKLTNEFMNGDRIILGDTADQESAYWNKMTEEHFMKLLRYALEFGFDLELLLALRSNRYCHYKVVVTPPKPKPKRKVGRRKRPVVDYPKKIKDKKEDEGTYGMQGNFIFIPHNFRIRTLMDHLYQCFHNIDKQLGLDPVLEPNRKRRETGAQF